MEPTSEAHVAEAEETPAPELTEALENLGAVSLTKETLEGPVEAPAGPVTGAPNDTSVVVPKPTVTEDSDECEGVDASYDPYLSPWCEDDDMEFTFEDMQILANNSHVEEPPKTSQDVA